jgi:hypothetical protein
LNTNTLNLTRTNRTTPPRNKQDLGTPITL